MLSDLAKAVTVDALSEIWALNKFTDKLDKERDVYQKPKALR